MVTCQLCGFGVRSGGRVCLLERIVTYAGTFWTRFDTDFAQVMNDMNVIPHTNDSCKKCYILYYHITILLFKTLTINKS